MSLDSVVPERPEPFAEDHALVVRKIFTVSERIRLASEACEIIPDTVEGAQAVFNVGALVDELHMTRYENVEPLIKQMRFIFERFNIHLEI